MNGGGTERHLYNLTTYLDSNKFECLIVAFDTGKTLLTDLIQRKTRIIHLPVQKFYSPNAFIQACKFIKIIKDFNPDIYQSFHFKSDTYGVLIAKIAGCRHIVSSRRDLGLNKKGYHFLLNRIFNNFIDQFIVVSNSVGKFIMLKEKVPSNKIYTIYNGVDKDYFKKPSIDKIYSLRRNYNIDNNDVIFGMVAVFRQEKRHDLILRAFRTALNYCKNIKLFFVGGGPLLDLYKEKCLKSGLGSTVLFSGAVSDVKPYLSMFDVGCLLSDTEGFSNAIIEKMAFGLPIIASGKGGNLEAISNGINGYLVSNDDINQLTKIIIELATNKEKRIHMGINSRKIVETKFSLRTMIDNYEKYYTNLVSRLNS